MADLFLLITHELKFFLSSGDGEMAKPYRSNIIKICLSV